MTTELRDPLTELPELMAQPDTLALGGGELGARIEIHMAAKGGGTWEPVRDPNVDYSAFGSWEAWQWCEIVTDEENDTVVARPTGEWGAWCREPNEEEIRDQVPRFLVFPNRPDAKLTAKQQAIILCNVRNGSLTPTPEQMQTTHPSTWPVNSLAKGTRVVQQFPEP